MIGKPLSNSIAIDQFDGSSRLRFGYASTRLWAHDKMAGTFPYASVQPAIVETHERFGLRDDGLFRSRIVQLRAGGLPIGFKSRRGKRLAYGLAEVFQWSLGSMMLRGSGNALGTANAICAMITQAWPDLSRWIDQALQPGTAEAFLVVSPYRTYPDNRTPRIGWFEDGSFEVLWSGEVAPATTTVDDQGRVVHHLGAVGIDLSFRDILDLAPICIYPLTTHLLALREALERHNNEAQQ